MNRRDFGDSSRFLEVGIVTISSVWVPNSGSPVCIVYKDTKSSKAYQVFEPEYGNYYRESETLPGNTDLFTYGEWKPLKT